MSSYGGYNGWDLVRSLVDSDRKRKISDNPLPGYGSKELWGPDVQDEYIRYSNRDNQETNSMPLNMRPIKKINLIRTTNKGVVKLTEGVYKFRFENFEKHS